LRNEDLKKIIIETNRTSKEPVDEDVLDQVLSLVMRYPLEDDRGICQEEMRKIMIRKVRE
jgi:hypothetical protein